MFGHQKDDNNAVQPAQVPDQPADVPADHVDQIVQPEAVPAPIEDAAASEPMTAPVDDSSPWQHPGTPINDTPAASPPIPPEPAQPAPISDIKGGSGPVSAIDLHTATPPSTPLGDEAADIGDLAGIRQKALGDLTPLIDHLEHQTPEEKFQVTMMMIQANDDKSLVPAAYEAAQKITDEKVRAQALLDIVQEINYFTQQSS